MCAIVTTLFIRTDVVVSPDHTLYNTITDDVFPYRQRLSDVYEKKSLNGTALW